MKLKFEFDKKYGYKHLVTLSGGLDSRTLLFYAYKLGYKNITIFTFSQKGYIDHKVSSKISKELMVKIYSSI